METAISNTKLLRKIQRLKAERKAIILAITISLGRSRTWRTLSAFLELSQKAAKTDAEVIVFCGVHFMAETQRFFVRTGWSSCGPDGRLLHVHMITAEAVRKMKAHHPVAVVGCYVNTSAAVKAESDICCTSSNAVKVVNSIPKDKEIIFIPDQYLASMSNAAGTEDDSYHGYCEHVDHWPRSRIAAEVLIRDEDISLSFGIELTT